LRSTTNSLRSLGRTSLSAAAIAAILSIEILKRATGGWLEHERIGIREGVRRPLQQRQRPATLRQQQHPRRPTIGWISAAMVASRCSIPERTARVVAIARVTLVIVQGTAAIDARERTGDRFRRLKQGGWPVRNPPSISASSFPPRAVEFLASSNDQSRSRNVQFSEAARILMAVIVLVVALGSADRSNVPT
jgi:hypothetical protein